MTATPVRDPGLQGERTALSWSRTSLALAVNGLLALRNGWQDGAVPLTVTGVVLIVVAAAFVLYGNLRGRSLAGNGRHHDRMPQAAPTIPLALLALATLAACGVGIASTLIQR
ncbi:DUF202 domain-containing protein [Rathayibacter sp. CAU 1779]